MITTYSRELRRWAKAGMLAAVMCIAAMPSAASLLMDQIGNAPGFVIEDFATSQYFEPLNTNFDIVGADDFVLSTRSELQQVDVVMMGWNGFNNFTNVQWYQLNVYSSPAAASNNLTGNILSKKYLPGEVTVTTPYKTGIGYTNALIEFPMPAGTLLNAGTYWIGVIARMDFSPAGQLAVAKGTFAGFPANTNAIQANPNQGFGFGRCWTISPPANLAYRIHGSTNLSARFLAHGLPTITLPRGPTGGGLNPMAIAYHPGVGKYYGGTGGNTGYPGYVWGPTGALQQSYAPIGVDIRGVNYNPYRPFSNRVEVVTYNAVGGGTPAAVVAMGLTNGGFYGGINTNVLSIMSGAAGGQTMPAYDFTRNRYYSRSGGSVVNVIDGNNGSLLSTITLNFAAAGIGAVQGEFIGFDPDFDWLVVADSLLDRAYVFNMAGAFVGVSQISNFNPSQGSFNAGYANGQLFVFNTNINAYVGFRIMAAYCPAQGGGAEYISKVTVGSITNSSGSGLYQNFTALSTDMARGSSHPIQVVNGSPYATDVAGLWVDWNQDGDFDDTGETIPTSWSNSGPYNAVITVPVGAALGATTMRVRLYDYYYDPISPQPCGNTIYGEVEDYSIVVQAHLPLECPPGAIDEGEGCVSPLADLNGGCNVTPAVFSPIVPGQTVCGTAFTTNGSTRDTDWYQFTLAEPRRVTWTATAELPLTIILADGTPSGSGQCPPVAIVSATALPFETTNVSASLAAGTYWAFAAPSVFDGYPCNSGANRYVATLLAVPVACEASATIKDEYISRVRVGTIDNSSEWTNYADYTALSTEMRIGSNYAITVTLGTSYSSDTGGLWVDWNQDGDFDEPGETITTNWLGTGPYTASITPPVGALLGSTRMRVRLQYAQPPQPCGQSSYGEVEDYTIVVKAFPAVICPPGAIDEGEPCGQDFNGGCNSTPPLFAHIACGDTVCGTAWADGSVRDTDWYEFTLTQSEAVTWTVTADFPVQIALGKGCSTTLALSKATPGMSATVEQCLEPGTYWAWVGTQDFDGYPCGSGANNYVGTLTCKPCVPQPAGAVDEGEPCGEDTNGGCNSVPAVFTPLDVGETVYGLAWATNGTRDTDWYRFTLTRASKVTWTAQAEFPLLIFLMDGTPSGSGQCPQSLYTYASGAPYETVTVSANFGPGTYLAWAGPSVFDGYPCDSGSNRYVGTLTAETADCPKWRQSPDCQHGMDLESVSQWNPQHSFEPLNILYRVADDWLCDGRPITGVRWWGSYIDNPQNTPPLGGRPDGFVLRWWTDIPTNKSVAGYSMPGVEITNAVGWLQEYGQPIVTESLLCTSDLSFVQQGMVEYEYEYSMPLPQPWIEKEGNVYWLSIEAFYNVQRQPPAFWWGWKTTTPAWNWNDAAVLMDPTAGMWIKMTYPPAMPPWSRYSITNHPYKGQSMNMAFELLTDVCPSRCKKWSQLPDMRLGTDMWSWRHQFPVQGWKYQLRADDFISDGRPISDIHWWGSYSNWWSWMPGSDTNPVLPPQALPLKPLGFDLSWHSGQPSCVPDGVLTNLFVPIEKCHEVFYGSVLQSWVNPGAPYYEHEYQYYVDLLDPEVSGRPWLELKGTHYWVNVQAVFTNAFIPTEQPEMHGGWGWKTTPNPQLCPSVVSNATVDGGGWTVDIRPPPVLPGPFDLAFELTTTDIPATNSTWYQGMRFANAVTDHPATSAWLTSTGYCGCGKQVLQESTNLLQAAGGWRDVQTNVVPRYQNTWIVSPVKTQGLYRIKAAP